MSSDRFWTAFYFLFMPDNVVLKIRPSPRCRSPRKEIFVLVYAVLIDVAMILFLPRYAEFSKSELLYQKRVSCKDRASRQLKINELILTLSYPLAWNVVPFGLNFPVSYTAGNSSGSCPSLFSHWSAYRVDDWGIPVLNTWKQIIHEIIFWEIFLHRCKAFHILMLRFF